MKEPSSYWSQLRSKSSELRVGMRGIERTAEICAACATTLVFGTVATVLATGAQAWRMARESRKPAATPTE